MATQTQTSSLAVAKEYEALTHDVALIDRSHIGRLKFSGNDALDLLNRLSTNHLADMEVGHALPTVLTSNKGRIVDVLLVLRQADHLLAFTSPETRKAVAEYIDFYTFSEDVSVEDVTDETSMLGVSGPKAEEWANKHTVNLEASVKVVRSDFLHMPGYDIVAPIAQRASLYKQLQTTGATPVNADTVEAVRIERGVPIYGHELGEDYNPLEAGLKHFISFSKGCYVGQEVVARLDTYKKVQRRLVSLKWNADAIVATGSELILDGDAVGTLTSSARLPSGEGVGLGYVKRSVPENSEVAISAQGKIFEAKLIEITPKD
ncbi:MAG: hypothetical protein O2854_01420 [Chloroflexi bacterium]|nr:hypothetical protein [Chloroflexota bacterium]